MIMWQTMLRMAMRLDSAGQHDLADAMERLAAKLPFHVDTSVLKRIMQTVPEEFESWVKGLGDEAFDLAKIRPEVYRTVRVPGSFYNKFGGHLHPDKNIGVDEAVRAEREDLFKHINSRYNVAKRGGATKDYDPERSFIPGQSDYAPPPGSPAGNPAGGKAGPTPGRPPGPPPPGPAPSPEGRKTGPGPRPGRPPSPPPPGPAPSPPGTGRQAPPPPTGGSTGRGPGQPPPGYTTPPPRGPAPPPGVVNPQPSGTPRNDPSLWQQIPWWVKWGPVGYMGYRTLRPKDERRSTNVTPPTPVIHDPRQDYRDVPYNPYYGRPYNPYYGR